MTARTQRSTAASATKLNKNVKFWKDAVERAEKRVNELNENTEEYFKQAYIRHVGFCKNQLALALVAQAEHFINTH